MKYRIEFRPPAELYAAGAEIAKQIGISINNVAAQAFASYVRNWTPPLARKGKKGQVDNSPWPSGWPKSEICPACSTLHDPAEHPLHGKGSVGGHIVKRAFDERGLAHPGASEP